MIHPIWPGLPAMTVGLSILRNAWWSAGGTDASGARPPVYLPEEDIASYSDRYVMTPPHHALDYLCQEVLPARGWISGVIGVEMDNYYYSATSHQALQRGLPQAQLLDATGLQRLVRRGAVVV